MEGAAMIIVYILAAVGVMALGMMFYNWLVPDQSEIAPHGMTVDPPLDGEASARALAANLDAPLIDGNSIDMLLNGDEIFPAMLEAIRHARRSVNLLTYIYWQGDIARRFADELAAAVQRGVKVRLLVDAVGGGRMAPATVERLEQAGCSFAWFRPLRAYNLGRFNDRTHRKVMVVDGHTGFTGGVGIADVWTGHGQDPAHWRDDHFRVCGPVVRYLQGSFGVNWRQATSEVLAGEELFPDLEEAWAARIVAIDAAPSIRVSTIGFAYWLFFHGARETIRVTTPYYVPDPRLHLGLMVAARRGVDATLLVPGPPHRLAHRVARQQDLLPRTPRSRRLDPRVPADDDPRQDRDHRRHDRTVRITEFRYAFVQAELRGGAGRL
ncbi:MAG TPA: phospholipase D-like domain-containing protein [Rhodanobacteraceae bacterium]|nr:phospholipase D-like domain-containing protein [Rhodanobacteraceae bacterium]